MLAPQREDTHVSRDHRVPPEVVSELLEEAIGDNASNARRVGFLAGVGMWRGEDAGGEAVLREVAPIPVRPLPAVGLRQNHE
eukprot:9319259-Alexandrium_andersonii.AAC.1